MAYEEFYRAALEVLMSVRNNVAVSQVTPDVQSRSLEACVSTHLIATTGMERKCPAPDLLSHIGAHMRTSL